MKRLDRRVIFSIIVVIIVIFLMVLINNLDFRKIRNKTEFDLPRKIQSRNII